MTAITKPAPLAAPAPVKRSSGLRKVINVVVLIVAIGFGLVMLAPFLIVVLNAFKSSEDYSNNGALSWPQQIDFSAFQAYLAMVDFPVALWNSILISAVVAVVGVLVSLVSAYALGIGRVKGRMSMLAVLLVATMVPQEALIYPLFYGAQATGTLNTVWSVTIIFIVLQAAFGTYLLSGVLTTFPRELLEAAMVDGAQRWRILWSVVFPVLRPTLSVLLVFFFIWTWNEFYIPVVLLGDQASQTVPIALATLRGQHTIHMTVINAGSFLSMLPTIIFFLIFQRTLSNGITAGALK